MFHILSMLTDEKIEFSRRLKAALKRSRTGVATPTELAIQFSLRHPNEAITPQAAQKWLTGKARPRSDKMETLAEWLEVPVHWLSFGPPKPVRRELAAQRAKVAAKGAGAQTLSDDEMRWVERLRRVSAHQRALLLDLAEQLALEREISRGEG